MSGYLDEWWLTEIFKMFSAVPARDRQYRVWRCDAATWKIVRRLQLSDHQPIWVPSLIADGPDMLLGKPVEVTDEVVGIVLVEPEPAR
jgi:HK97 family phage major capsid protein